MLLTFSFLSTLEQGKGVEGDARPLLGTLFLLKHHPNLHPPEARLSFFKEVPEEISRLFVVQPPGACGNCSCYPLLAPEGPSHGSTHSCLAKSLNTSEWQ